MCGDKNGENYTNGCLNEVDNFLDNTTVIKDHHHYEGIGKYNGYFAGWEDAITDSSWIETLPNNYRIAYSQKKFYYENTLRNRAKSNSDNAETALTAIFIVVSMVFTMHYAKQSRKSVDCSTPQSHTQLGTVDKVLLIAFLAVIIWVIYGVTAKGYYIPELATQFFVLGLIVAIIAKLGKRQSISEAVDAFKHGSAA